MFCPSSCFLLCHSGCFLLCHRALVKACRRHFLIVDIHDFCRLSGTIFDISCFAACTRYSWCFCDLCCPGSARCPVRCGCPGCCYCLLCPAHDGRDGGSGHCICYNIRLGPDPVIAECELVFHRFFLEGARQVIGLRLVSFKIPEGGDGTVTDIPVKGLGLCKIVSRLIHVTDRILHGITENTIGNNVVGIFGHRKGCPLYCRAAVCAAAIPAFFRNRVSLQGRMPEDFFCLISHPLTFISLLLCPYDSSQ